MQPVHLLVPTPPFLTPHLSAGCLFYHAWPRSNHHFPQSKSSCHWGILLQGYLQIATVTSHTLLIPSLLTSAHLRAHGAPSLLHTFWVCGIRQHFGPAHRCADHQLHPALDVPPELQNSRTRALRSPSARLLLACILRPLQHLLASPHVVQNIQWTQHSFSILVLQLAPDSHLDESSRQLPQQLQHHAGCVLRLAHPFHRPVLYF